MLEEGEQLFMKARRQADWSFMLLRGAEHSVKQFTFKKRSLIATPVALLAIISGCFIGMKIQAASQIKDLELQIASLSSQHQHANDQYEASLQLHQHTIVELEKQLQLAYEKQRGIDEKLLELTALEEQLEAFITTYGTHTPLELDRETMETDVNLNLNKNGSNYSIIQPLSYSEKSSPTVSQLSYSAPMQAISQQDNAHEIANYAAIHELPISELSKLVDNFVEVMHYNLNKAGKIKQKVDAYPDFWPASNMITTSGYGYRNDPFTKQIRFHAGIDINGSKGDVIFSAGDGKVLDAGYHHSYGYYIIIEHSEQLKTLYGHLSSIEAKSGDTVVKGEKIGLMGSTGRSTGTHLHFQVMLNDQPVSPLKYLIKPN